MLQTSNERNRVFNKKISRAYDRIRSKSNRIWNEVLLFKRLDAQPRCWPGMFICYVVLPHHSDTFAHLKRERQDGKKNFFLSHLPAQRNKRKEGCIFLLLIHVTSSLYLDSIRVSLARSSH